LLHVKSLAKGWALAFRPHVATATYCCVCNIILLSSLSLATFASENGGNWQHFQTVGFDGPADRFSTSAPLNSVSIRSEEFAPDFGMTLGNRQVAGQNTIAVLNPATGAGVGAVANTTIDDLDQAISAAEAAYSARSLPDADHHKAGCAWAERAAQGGTKEWILILQG
jgi:hypothetical protein